MPKRLLRDPPHWLPAFNPWSAAGHVRHALATWHPRHVPPLTRANYRRELIAAAFLPWSIAAVEGGVIGVILKNYFEGRADPTLINWCVNIAVAAPNFANILSFVFVRLSHGRHKVRSVNILQITAAVLIAALSQCPRTTAGLVLMTALAVAARVALAGIVTLRSSIWRANFPWHARASLTARIATVHTLLISVSGAILAVLMEYAEWSLRLYIPLAAALGLVGVRSWSRVRVRRHRALLRAERTAPRSEGPSFNPLAMAGLLWRDRAFAAYMVCQFLAGFGNLMIQPLVVLLAKDRFGMGYFEGALVAHVIPVVIMPVLMRPWAALLDRWHVVTYRAVHTWIFVVMTLCLFGGASMGWVWLMYAASVVRGIAFAGGAIAWNLGHNDFAKDHNAAQYMAVHVTLTGVRGLLSPLAGLPVYLWLRRDGDGTGGEGASVFLLSAGITAAGAVGFAWMQFAGMAARKSEDTGR